MFFPVVVMSNWAMLYRLWFPSCTEKFNYPARLKAQKVGGNGGGNGKTICWGLSHTDKMAARS